MANLKVSELTQITTIASGDKLLITDISEPEGSKSKQITIQQLDARFGAPLGATPVGEMVIVDNTTPTDILVINEWVKAIGFVPDNLNQFEFLDDTLIAKAAGRYFLNGTLYGERSASGTDTFEVAFFLNDILVTKTKGARAFTNALGSLSTSVILNINVDDELTVYIRNTTGTADFTARTVLVNLHGI